MNWSSKAINYLSQPMPGHLLGLFRIIFGCFMVYEVLLYIQIDLVANAFILPKVQLAYFDFLKPLPAGALNGLLYTMLACSLLITLGLLFRPACFLFATIFLYFLLLDKGIFNNHLYLFILLAFVLGFTHADRFFSVRNLLGKACPATFLVQRWEIFVLQLHFAIVYFYGGLAKINPDWLFNFQPMKFMVESYPPTGPLAPLLKLDIQPFLLAYGGLVFDLAIPFLLWWKRTRWWSLLPLLYFHVSNALIFNDIGIFPYIMVLSTVIFFEVSELPVLRNLVKGKPKNTVLLTSPGWAKKVLLGYLAFLLLFPLRGLFLPNPVNWTAIANRFSWRMKCQSRQIEEFSFTIQDGPSGQKMPVEIDKFINPMQIIVVAQDVVAVASVAKELARQGREQGMAAPLVHANIKVKWNGRPGAYTVKQDVNLAEVEASPFMELDWVMPVPGVE